MIVVKLYNGVFQKLANDEIIQDLLEIDTSLGSNEFRLLRADKIQKRRKPQNLADNIPLIAFYTVGGGKDPTNDRVWGSTFVFDIYTNDDVEKAHRIGERISELFDGSIPPFAGITTFESELEDAYESKTDLPNTYCWTVIITMFVGLED